MLSKSLKIKSLHIVVGQVQSQHRQQSVIIMSTTYYTIDNLASGKDTILRMLYYSVRSIASFPEAKLSIVKYLVLI